MTWGPKTLSLNPRASSPVPKPTCLPTNPIPVGRSRHTVYDNAAAHSQRSKQPCVDNSLLGYHNGLAEPLRVCSWHRQHDVANSHLSCTLVDHVAAATRHCCYQVICACLCAARTQQRDTQQWLGKRGKHTRKAQAQGGCWLRERREGKRWVLVPVVYEARFMARLK